MAQEACPQCGSDTFHKGPSNRAQVSEGLRLVQVQCDACGWTGGYGFETALPQYVTPTVHSSDPNPSQDDLAWLMIEEWRQQDRRRLRRQRLAVRVVLAIVVVSSIAWAIFQIGLPSQPLDSERPPTQTEAPQSQESPESTSEDIPLQELVLKSYQPGEGFTTTVKPMRVWRFWEGASSSTQRVSVEETPWVVLWDYRETSVLGPRFRVSVTSLATGLTEVVMDTEAPSGANYALLHDPSEHEISVEASGTQWKVWVLLEP